MITAWLGQGNIYKPYPIYTDEDKLIKNKQYADDKDFTYLDANNWNGAVEGTVAEQKQSKKIEGLS